MTAQKNMTFKYLRTDHKPVPWMTKNPIKFTYFSSNTSLRKKGKVVFYPNDFIETNNKEIHERRTF